MDNHGAVCFRPRRSFRRIWILVAGFGVFVPLGVVLYFATGQKAALFAVAFGLLPALYMLYRVLAPGAEYSIGPDGVFLKRGRSRRLVALNQIRGAAVLSEAQARDILKRYMAPAVDAQRERDTEDYLATSRIYNSFTAYCTVPIVQEMTSVGPERNIVKFGTKVGGRFVLLKLTTGEELLLSPEDCDGFFAGLAGRTRLADTSPSSSYAYSVDQLRRERTGSLLKRYTWVSLLAVLMAVVAVSSLNVVLNPERRNAGSEGGAVETGWIDGNTFRYVVNIQMETHQESPELRQQELIEAATIGGRLSLTSQILGWYCAEAGITPDEEQSQALHRALEQLASRVNPRFSLDPVGKGATQLTLTMDYSGPELRRALKDMLDQTLKGVPR